MLLRRRHSRVIVQRRLTSFKPSNHRGRQQRSILVQTLRRCESASYAAPSLYKDIQRKASYFGPGTRLGHETNAQISAPCLSLRAASCDLIDTFGTDVFNRSRVA